MTLVIEAEKFERIYTNYRQIMQALKKVGEIGIVDFNNPGWHARAFVETGTFLFFSMDGDKDKLVGEITLLPDGNIKIMFLPVTNNNVDAILSTILTDPFFKEV